MLVLSRKQKESIFINDNVVVTVLRIRGDQVKIGIEAPSDVPVHRKEIFEKIRGLDAEVLAMRAKA
jgi:carbon storage regulator